MVSIVMTIGLDVQVRHWPGAYCLIGMIRCCL